MISSSTSSNNCLLSEDLISHRDPIHYQDDRSWESSKWSPTIGGGRGGAGGAEAPLNEILGGLSPPHVSVPKISATRQKIGLANYASRSTSGYKYMNHLRSFQQNSCHQNATSRGPQTATIVFDIYTCGIGDFREHGFFPAPPENLP